MSHQVLFGEGDLVTLLGALTLALLISNPVFGFIDPGGPFRALGPEKAEITGLARNQAKELFAVAKRALKKYDEKEKKWVLFDEKAPEEINKAAYSLAINQAGDIFVGTLSPKGLFRLKSGHKEWEVVSSKRFHEHFFSHLFVDPKDGQHLFALRNSSLEFLTEKAGFNQFAPQMQFAAPQFEGHTAAQRDLKKFTPNPTGAKGPADGYLMQSTDGGGTWKVIRSNEMKGALRSFSMDEKGNIAIGGGGVALYSHDGGKTFESLPSVPSPVTAIQMTKDGKIVTAGNKISIFDPAQKKWSTTAGGPHAIYLLSDSFGTVYVIVRRELTTWKQEEVYLVEKNELVPITNGKIQLFDQAAVPETFAKITCVLSGEDNKVWFGSDNGVFAFEQK